MNLIFSEPRPVSMNGEILMVQRAAPTQDFWKRWRFDRDNMSSAGIYVEKIDGRHVVTKLTRQDNTLPQVKLAAPYLVKNRDGLLPHQPASVAALCASMAANRIAIDASDAGTGKTYVAAAVCREMGLIPGVVCTKAGIPAWTRVLSSFGVKPYFIENWEGIITRKIKQRTGGYKPQGSFKHCTATMHQFTGELTYHWNIPADKRFCLIVDEFHKANGAGSSQQKAILAAKCYPIIALSATLADRLETCKAIISLCGIFDNVEFAQFMKERGVYKNRFGKFESLSDGDDMNRVNKLLFPAFGIRVAKKDIPGFPDIQNCAEVYPIKKAHEHNVAYHALKKELQGKNDSIAYYRKIKEAGADKAKIAEMSQLILKANADKMTLNLRYRQLTEYLKIDLFKELAEEHLDNNLSVVIFVNFTDTLMTLAERMKTKSVIHGGQSPAEREKIIQDFQADRARIIIANIAAGGVSISLHDLNGRHPRVSLISPTYSAIQLVQVLGRIHRAGAKSKAMNKLIYAEGTVEVDVCKTVSQKLDSINALNDGDLAETDIFNLMKE